MVHKLRTMDNLTISNNEDLETSFYRLWTIMKSDSN